MADATATAVGKRRQKVTQAERVLHLIVAPAEMGCICKGFREIESGNFRSSMLLYQTQMDPESYRDFFKYLNHVNSLMFGSIHVLQC